MRTEKEILELRAAVHTQQRAILDRASAEKRALTAEEDAQWQRADVDFAAFTAELERVRNLQEREAEAQRALDAEPVATRAQLQDAQGKQKEDAEKWARELFFGGGVSRAEAFARMNSGAGAQRASTSSTGTGLYVMPEEFIRTLELTMKQFGGMLQAAYVHRSASGNPLRWPTHDGTAETGNWVAQPRSSDITPRGLTFGRKSLNAHTWYDIIGLDWEFIQDEQVGLVSTLLAQLLGESAGRALNKAFTDGDGSGKPTGILDGTSGAGLGKETAANNAFTKAELLEMVHSVDPAYRNGASVAWMFHDDTLRRIRQLDFGTTDDEPIWQPSFQVGEPDTILGHRYIINQDFPTFAAGAKIAVFGDWSKYIIRMVRDMGVVRLDETFAARMQTAFLGWLRVDGLLLQSSALKTFKIKA